MAIHHVDDNVAKGDLRICQHVQMKRITAAVFAQGEEGGMGTIRDR